MIKSAGATIDKTTPYHLRVVAKEAEIKVYVDDMNVAKLEATDSAFQTGAIGLRGFGGETVIFENVVVKK